MSQVIVVGGGLSGLSAAHTVLEHGANVLLLDKNPFLGGNSTKATSGINGSGTKTQIKLGIEDSNEKFYEDTLKSARTRAKPDIIRVLTHESAPAVEWLQARFNLDLSLVSRLGGHSFPRTHRGKERFPGMTITYALMEKYEEICKNEPHRARLLTKARVTKLLTNPEGAVIGVEYQKDGNTFVEYGAVVLATGGYAADFTENSLLRKYRPDICHLATTNGDHCTGDGIKLASEIGGNSIDMDMVQVHPTGLVDPKEPDSKIKFLAAEALRGVGGLLLNGEGKRFCNELGHRDYVTGEIWKDNKPPYLLVLNSKSSKEIEWHCKHYAGRGLMKKFNSGHEFAAEYKIRPDQLADTFKKFNEIAQKNSDPFGRKFFENLPWDMNDEFHVAIIVPVVHYCMGGLEIGPNAQVIGKNGPIPGLYATGELCGGVHGENRLGGSSLLDCVVFGRVSGDSVARHLFETMAHTLSSPSSAARRIASVGRHLEVTVSHPSISTHVEVDPNERRLNFEISWPSSSSAPSVSAPSASSSSAPAPVSAPSAPAPAPAPTAAPVEETKKTSVPDKNKEWTLEEVAKHNKENDCWVIVNGQVLDVTDFLKDHPGGKKAILIYAGKDATEEFNMLHKPDVVEKYAPNSVIGRVAPRAKL